MPLRPREEFHAVLGRCERECPDETVALIDELIECGDVARAASICSHELGRLDVGALVEAHALEFIDAGHPEVVEMVVLDEGADIEPLVRRSVSFVLGALRNPRPNEVFDVRAQTVWECAEDASFGLSIAEQLDPLSEEAQSFLRLLCLLTDPHRYHQCARRALAPLVSSRLCRHFATLMDAILLCFDGRHDEALYGLARFARSTDADSVAGAVAAVFGFADTIAQGSGAPEELLGAATHAIDFLYRCHYDSLAAECEALVLSTRALFDGSTRADALVEANGRVQRLCHPHLRQLFTLALAIAHLRERSHFAAHRAISGQAKACEDQGMNNLSWAFSILERLCADLLGVRNPRLHVPATTSANDLGIVPVRRLVEDVSNEVFDLQVTFDVDCVRDLFEGFEPSPLARSLVMACVESGWAFGEKLLEHIPQPWCPRTIEEEADRPARADARASAPRIPRLSIHVLGEFEVYVGGKRVPEEQWRRRAAKALLCALAIVPSHSLARVHLFEMLWPDRDYVSCRNNLYTVLSAVRRAIGCHEHSLPYLICEDGRITLNPKLVSCDIDVFDRLCKTLIAHEGSLEHRLSACRKVRDLFLTGLYVPNQDPRGDFAARKRNVEELYVDALVEGAELALALGYVKEALWFANDACVLAPLREDCMVERLRALSREGRTFELNRVFATYCDDLEHELAMSPSERMRSLFQELSEDSRRAARERERFQGEGAVLPFRPLGHEGAS